MGSSTKSGVVEASSLRLRWAVLLVAVLAAASAAAGSPLRSSYLARLTADEPHYLLTALSLAEDRSLDVSDEHAEERYRPFHEVRLKPQAEVQPSGRMVVPHDPALPALLAIPMRLGGWLAARLTLALLAGALAGLTLHTAVRGFGAGTTAATFTIGMLAASAPLAVYGSQIYPELPAALMVVAAVACLAGRLRGRGLAGLGLSIVVLVWLGTKYVPVAGVLASIAMVRLLQAGRRRDLLATASAFTVAGILYLAAHLRWYGGLTVYAAGAFFAGTGQLSVLGVTPDYLARTVRLSGLLVDRQFGLAAWQPAWLLMLPALGWLIRRRPGNWHLLALPLAVGWLGATYLALTMHGWWFPGRQVVVVLPLAAITVALWLTGSAGRLYPALAAGLVGVFNLAWLFVEGWHGELTLVVDFFHTSNPLYRWPAALLPEYMRPSTRTEVLHALWAAACLILLLGGAGFPGRDRLARLRPRPGALPARRP